MGDWQQGLFGCFGNIGMCLMSWFVPCYIHGKNAEAVGEDCLLCGLSIFVPFLNWYTLFVVRGKIREQRGIAGEPVNDILVTLCCTPCALSQESVEMRNSTGLGMGQSMARV
ncbi:cell number regulator 10-like [Acanthaster planci]|uniref:Cell number regulator 10-like n=1 Tax=Acanthaster planci TaxID=133434 RepID=A0A8B7XTF8_ACAPL|nr:cell number regulator 10-like [Acanthaster planci]